MAEGGCLEALAVLAVCRCTVHDFEKKLRLKNFEVRIFDKVFSLMIAKQ
jgi:hypothetical protein